MGNWQLEVVKMGIYMTFPVALFHLFNQPKYFEDWVTNTRRELYPPEDTKERARLEATIQVMREKAGQEFQKALDSETQ